MSVVAPLDIEGERGARIKSGRKSHPRGVDSASIISRIAFFWISPLLTKAAKDGKLDHEDAETVSSPLEDAHWLGKCLEEEYKRRLAIGQKWPLVRAIIFIQRWNIFLHNFWSIGESALKILAALSLRELLEEIDEKDDADRTRLWVSGFVLSAAGFGLTITHHQGFFYGMRIGFQIRVAAISAVYRKVLRLGSTALMGTASNGGTSTGQTVNLVSNDVQRFDMAGIFYAYLYLGPIDLIVVLILVGEEIGYIPAVSGLSTLILLIPVQARLSRYIGKLRRRAAELTDSRVKVMSEVLSGILAVKMSAWEEPFSDKISNIRKREISAIIDSSMIKAVNVALFFTASTLISFVTFSVAWALGKTLTESKVFFIIALIQLPRLTMTMFFLNGVESVSQSSISCRRLAAFLSLPELTPSLLSRKAGAAPEKKDQGPSVEPVVEIVDSDFDWSGPVHPVKEFVSNSTLKGINFRLGCGELVGICGSVGAGKSSLLSAILGEIPQTRGDAVRVDIPDNGSIAYCSQAPWIIAGSVKENIEFGQERDKELMKEVITTCALEQDIAMLADGLETELGEKGVNLSGGQKARVALARAAIATLAGDAKLVLLDDPLSAVDAAVAQTLFEDCICGTMKGASRVLVTHQRQFLPKCDRIVVVDEGKITATGTYEEIKSSGCFSMDGLFHLETPEEVEDANGITAEPMKESITEKPAARVESTVGLEKLVEDEDKERGTVSASVYKEYLILGGIYGCIGVGILMLFGQVLLIASQYWLAEWTRRSDDEQERPIYVIIFGTLTGVLIFISILRAISFFVRALTASRELHDKMLSSILSAPLVVFHRNPVGRLLNRFSKDLGVVDDLLPLVFFDSVQSGMLVVGTSVIVVVAVPVMVAVLVPLATTFYFLRRYFMNASREVKRLESTTRSPVYATFSASLKGLATIRAFKGAKERFLAKFNQEQDANSVWWFAFMSIARWLGYRLDLLAATVLSGGSILAILLRNELSPALIGLALAQSLELSGLLQWCTRQAAEVENFFTSVERAIAYTRLPQEPQSVRAGGKNRPGNIPDDAPWPSSGELVVKSLNARYRPGLPLVLKDLSITIKPGESVGIVGRTGSGKSSLLLALLRLIDLEPETKIFLDGGDALDLAPDEWRRQWAIIPQDPTLFSGSIRFNLDPFQLYSDAQLHSALQAVHLMTSLKRISPKQSDGSVLDIQTAESGLNLSAGERQLLCLARALLRRAWITAMDEATANVDSETDSLIQSALSRGSGLESGKAPADAASQQLYSRKEGIRIVIAHRLDTVMHCDKILVLKSGRLLEFDSPDNLLSDPSSAFARMVHTASMASKTASSNMVPIMSQESLNSQSSDRA